MDSLSVRFFDGDAERTCVIPALDKDTVPGPIQKFNEALMGWYHRIGKFSELTAEALLEQHPSYALSINDFLVEVQSGGEKYPKAICVSVYNPAGVIVDECNIMYTLPDRPLPASRKWTHGAPVIDASDGVYEKFGVAVRPFATFHENDLGVELYITEENDPRVKGIFLGVVNLDGDHVYLKKYLWSPFIWDEFLATVNWKTAGRVDFVVVGVVDARRAMRFIPPDPAHPEFLPPMSDRDRYDRVVEYIEAERMNRGVRPHELGIRCRREPSCEAMGEGYNLVESQLMYTREGYGAWKSLYGEVLDLAFNYVVLGRRF